MPPLHELQADFRRALIERDAGAILPAIVDDQIAAAARLQIYQNHVRITLTEALQANFPVVCRLVDERFFAYACSVYIQEQPPEGPCLSEYGQGFPNFLERFPACRDLPWLGDVARFERAVNAVLHADDTPPLDVRSLAAVPPADRPRLMLRFRPDYRLLASRFPVDRIWQANRRGVAPGAVDLPVDLNEGEAALEIRRVDDDVVYRRLDRSTFLFRYLLRAGRTLERAATAALRADPGFDLVNGLGTLLAEGVLARFILFPTLEPETSR